MIEEEIGRCIFDVYVIAQSVVPTIAGNAADRFEASSPLIFQLHKVHRTVYTDAQTGNDFITYLKNSFHCYRLQLRDIIYHTFHIQLFLYIQLTTLLFHITDGGFKFCIYSSPGDTRISLFHFNLTGIHHALLCERTFDISQSGNSCFTRSNRFQHFISNYNPYISLIVEQVNTFHQQRKYRVGSSYRRVPLLCLLLLQQPKFHFFHGIAVTAYRLQCFHHIYVSLHLHSAPCIRILVESKEHSLFIRLGQEFFQRSDKFLCFFLASGFIQYNSGNRFRIHRRRSKQFSYFRKIIGISSFIGSRHLLSGNSDEIQILQNTARNTGKFHSFFLCFQDFLIFV